MFSMEVDGASSAANAIAGKSKSKALTDSNNFLTTTTTPLMSCILTFGENLTVIIVRKSDFDNTFFT
ncbi:hypothetical protein PCURB6_05020 [Paenibacillus curdlanolyticus]|nr:hypothetical protein PCURB6_05020 [Paenibacillus curdlanolyticus]